MAKKTDVDVIVGDEEVVTLSSGTQVKLEPLKSRQFLKLLRIITHGAGGMLLNVQFDTNDSPEAFAAKLLALVGFAIPDAEDEVFDFLASMLKPVGYKDGRALTKAERTKNEELKLELLDELENPELEDLVTLVEAIVKNEAEDLQALGKRVMSMFDLAKKTGQVPANLVKDSES